MSLINTLSRIFARAAGAARVVVGIGRQLLPFVRAAREVVPQVDQYLDKLEAGIAQGGEAADDFLDRNLPTVHAMEGFYTEMEEFGRTGKAYTQYAILASQSVTPDALEPAEVQELARLMDEHRAAIKALLTKIDETQLEAKLQAIE